MSSGSHWLHGWEVDRLLRWPTEMNPFPSHGGRKTSPEEVSLGLSELVEHGKLKALRGYFETGSATSEAEGSRCEWWCSG